MDFAMFFTESDELDKLFFSVEPSCGKKELQRPCFPFFSKYVDCREEGTLRGDSTQVNY